MFDGIDINSLLTENTKKIGEHAENEIKPAPATEREPDKRKAGRPLTSDTGEPRNHKILVSLTDSEWETMVTEAHASRQGKYATFIRETFFKALKKNQRDLSKPPR